MKSKLITIIISGVVSVAAIGASVGLVVYNHTNTSETSEIKSEVSADADSKSNAEDAEQKVDIDPADLLNEAAEATKNVQSMCVTDSSNLDTGEKIVEDITFERQTYIDVASGQEIFDLSGGGHDECNLKEKSFSPIDEVLWFTRLHILDELTDLHISKVTLNGNERYKLEALDSLNIDYIYYIDPETKLVTNLIEEQSDGIRSYQTYVYNVPYSFGE